MNLKEFEKGKSWSNSRYYYCICLEGLRKSWVHFEDFLCWGRDSCRTPSKCKSDLSTNSGKTLLGHNIGPEILTKSLLRIYVNSPPRKRPIIQGLNCLCFFTYCSLDSEPFLLMESMVSTEYATLAHDWFSNSSYVNIGQFKGKLF
jgi:hypothetical protein